MQNTLIPALFLLWPALLGNLASAGQTWDGGGPNDNWSHGFNWNDPDMFQFPPSNNGTANIVMPAMGGLVQTPIDDVPYSINSLTFAGGDGSTLPGGGSLPRPNGCRAEKASAGAPRRWPVPSDRPSIRRDGGPRPRRRPESASEGRAFLVTR